MSVRLYKIVLCAIFALAAGMTAIAAVEAASTPTILSHIDWLWSSVLTGALFYIFIPLSALCVAALLGRTPSTGFSLLVAVGWLTIIFAWWVKKPWVYYGEFPWHGFQHHYLGMLPVPLSFGLAFAMCARKVLGPNKALNPDRWFLRFSGHPELTLQESSTWHHQVQERRIGTTKHLKRRRFV